MALFEVLGIIADSMPVVRGVWGKMMARGLELMVIRHGYYRFSSAGQFPYINAAMRTRLVDHDSAKPERVLGGAIVVRKRVLNLWGIDLVSIPIAHEELQNILVEPLGTREFDLEEKGPINQFHMLRKAQLIIRLNLASSRRKIETLLTPMNRKPQIKLPKRGIVDE